MDAMSDIFPFEFIVDDGRYVWEWELPHVGVEEVWVLPHLRYCGEGRVCCDASLVPLYAFDDGRYQGMHAKPQCTRRTDLTMPDQEEMIISLYGYLSITIGTDQTGSLHVHSVFGSSFLFSMR